MWERLLKTTLRKQAERMESSVDSWERLHDQIKERARGRRQIMRKPAFVVGIIFSMLLVGAGGVYGTQTYIFFKEPRNEREEKISQEIDQMLIEQRKRIDSTIEEAFGLDLEEYERKDVTEMWIKKEPRPLLTLVNSIMDKQQNGDMKPSVYISKLDDTKGYILENKVESYVLYIIELNKEGDWNITKTEQLQKN
ncbi:hypothetical protein T458_10500 [Brevibacillus panacihumi W25]|uniref:Uncharacterized protein n=1 Tax=Brevibacillus panacihumi W25 TaxID=1408254 RepID=V6M999_9BACL|nr:hypothetical protein [Brevibacillus panacihumi]EST55089.1 hypothetical protein T458_10500 [Brevibacillus panacihumi W25]